MLANFGMQSFRSRNGFGDAIGHIAAFSAREIQGLGQLKPRLFCVLPNPTLSSKHEATKKQVGPAANIGPIDQSGENLLRAQKFVACTIGKRHLQNWRKGDISY